MGMAELDHIRVEFVQYGRAKYHRRCLVKGKKKLEIC